MGWGPHTVTVMFSPLHKWERNIPREIICWKSKWQSWDPKIPLWLLNPWFFHCILLSYLFFRSVCTKDRFGIAFWEFQAVLLPSLDHKAGQCSLFSGYCALQWNSSWRDKLTGGISRKSFRQLCRVSVLVRKTFSSQNFISCVCFCHISVNIICWFHIDKNCLRQALRHSSEFLSCWSLSSLLTVKLHLLGTVNETVCT
jgi:hypothetical protein